MTGAKAVAKGEQIEQDRPGLRGQQESESQPGGYHDRDFNHHDYHHLERPESDTSQYRELDASGPRHQHRERCQAKRGRDSDRKH